MYNFIRKKIIHEAHMLFQYLCGFKPIFYFTHPNEEPININAHYFDDLINVMKNKSQHFIERVLKEKYWKKGTGNMNFNAVIGNPPYQSMDADGRQSSSPIYNFFVEQAKKINAQYVSMIIPARWYSGGKGLDQFRDGMLNDDRLRIIHDYPVALDCFQGVQIKGGICYFLWDKDNPGLCAVTNHSGNEKSETIERPLLESGCTTFIRFNESISILHKVQAFNERSFEPLVSTTKPFGLRTFVHGTKNKTSSSVTLFENEGVSYIDRSEITQGEDLINYHKVFIPAAGSGSDTFPHPILGKPIYGDIGTVCTETYCVIGPFNSKQTCENVISYIKTKFFRFMVMLKKPSQHAPAKVYSFAPVQDFSRSWTDRDLYQKYNLNEEEIAFIESMIKPME